MADVIARNAVLSQVRRQQVEWQRAASIAMAQGDPEAGLRAYAKHDRVELVSGEVEAKARVIQKWKDFRHAHGDDTLIITRRNADAAALNKAARAALRAEGRLKGPDRSLPAVDRDKKVGLIELARGDRIRFGENLPQLRIRNGTRGTIERLGTSRGEFDLTIRLDDGRLIEQQWASLVRERLAKVPDPPRISHAYAGTAYSVQGRTSATAILYIAKTTDARETYVGLTRHRVDACVVAESDRLEAAARKRQSDPRTKLSETSIRERLFAESRSYAEKANVVDYVTDRIEFMRTGQIEIQREERSLNLSRIARSAQRIFDAAHQLSSRHLSMFPAWRLIQDTRHVQREVSMRIQEVIRGIATRMEAKSKGTRPRMGYSPLSPHVRRGAIPRAAQRDR